MFHFHIHWDQQSSNNHNYNHLFILRRINQIEKAVNTIIFDCEDCSIYNISRLSYVRVFIYTYKKYEVKEDHYDTDCSVATLTHDDLKYKMLGKSCWWNNSYSIIL
jgi:hypothetical protein